LVLQCAHCAEDGALCIFYPGLTWQRMIATLYNIAQLSGTAGSPNLSFGSFQTENRLQRYGHSKLSSVLGGFQVSTVLVIKFALCLYVCRFGANIQQTQNLRSNLLCKIVQTLFSFCCVNLTQISSKYEIKFRTCWSRSHKLLSQIVL
jgi:hypothetical protein